MSVCFSTCFPAPVYTHNEVSASCLLMCVRHSLSPSELQIQTLRFRELMPFTSLRLTSFIAKKARTQVMLIKWLHIFSATLFVWLIRTGCWFCASAFLPFRGTLPMSHLQTFTAWRACEESSSPLSSTAQSAKKTCGRSSLLTREGLGSCCSRLLLTAWEELWTARYENELTNKHTYAYLCVCVGIHMNQSISFLFL